LINIDGMYFEYFSEQYNFLLTRHPI